MQFPKQLYQIHYITELLKYFILMNSIYILSSSFIIIFTSPAGHMVQWIIGIWLRGLLNEMIWRLQVQSWLQVNNKEYLLEFSTYTLVMVNRIRTIYSQGVNKRFGVKVPCKLLSSTWTPEGCISRNIVSITIKDEGSSPNTLNDKNCSTLD